jgi:hypothetical protein
MPSFKSICIGIALASLGAAQTVEITGKVQAQSPELGTVYLYQQFSDGGCKSLMSLFNLFNH